MAEQDKTGQVMMRFLKSLIVHAAVGGVAAAVLFDSTGGLDDAAPATREQFNGNEGVRAVLDPARGLLLEWLVLALVVSFLLSAFFLLSAQRRGARFGREKASRRGTWIALLLLAIAADLGLWWQLVITRNLAGILASASYLHAVGAGMLAVPLAYWLATAVAVTITMRPSVPLAGLRPDSWS